MFEAVPQELKESVEKALRKASRDVFEVLELTELVEVLVGRVSETLEEWADELRNLADETGGTQDRPLSNEEKYQYLIDAGSEKEKQRYSQERMKSYLLNTPDVLDALFEMHSWDWSKKQ